MDVFDCADQLGPLAEAAAHHDGWEAFAEFLRLRSQGRRAEALRALADFLASAEQWPFERRRTFLAWLHQDKAAERLGNLLIPEPLSRRLAAPTAAEWLRREANCARANYYCGLYFERRAEGPWPMDYFRRAHTLDPADQQVIEAFVSRAIGGAQNNQHELPCYGYLGESDEDVRDLTDALDMAKHLEPTQDQQWFEAELSKRLEIALAWQAYEQSGKEVGFETWCRARGGPAALIRTPF